MRIGFVLFLHAVGLRKRSPYIQPSDRLSHCRGAACGDRGLYSGCGLRKRSPYISTIPLNSKYKPPSHLLQHPILQQQTPPHAPSQFA